MNTSDIDKPVQSSKAAQNSAKFLMALGKALDLYIPGIADFVSERRFKGSDVSDSVRDKELSSQVSQYVSRALAQIDLDIDDLNRVRDILDRYDLSSSVPSLREKINEKKRENDRRIKEQQIKRSEIEIQGQKVIDDADRIDSMDDQYRLFINEQGSKANKAVGTLRKDINAIDYDKIDKPIINTVKENYKYEK